MVSYHAERTRADRLARRLKRAKRLLRAALPFVDSPATTHVESSEFRGRRDDLVNEIRRYHALKPARPSIYSTDIDDASEDT